MADHSAAVSTVKTPGAPSTRTEISIRPSGDNLNPMRVTGSAQVAGAASSKVLIVAKASQSRPAQVVPRLEESNIDMTPRYS